MVGPAVDRGEQPSPRARRIAAEVAGAAVGLGVTAGATAAVVFATMRQCDFDAYGVSDPCLWQATATTIFSAAFAATPIAAFGVWSGGRLAGGQGRYDFTLLGGSIGNALGWLGLTGLARADSDAAFSVGLALLPVLQAAGSIVGYELSHRAESGRDRRVAPTFSADRHGASLGLAGVF